MLKILIVVIIYVFQWLTKWQNGLSMCVCVCLFLYDQGAKMIFCKIMFAVCGRTRAKTLIFTIYQCTLCGISIIAGRPPYWIDMTIMESFHLKCPRIFLPWTTTLLDWYEYQALKGWENYLMIHGCMHYAISLMFLVHYVDNSELRVWRLSSTSKSENPMDWLGENID